MAGKKRIDLKRVRAALENKPVVGIRAPQGAATKSKSATGKIGGVKVGGVKPGLLKG
jgi:hypothetical protein